MLAGSPYASPDAIIIAACAGSIGAFGCGPGDLDAYQERAGPPATVGPPDSAGPPATVGPPDSAGPSATVGPPATAGPPATIGPPPPATSTTGGVGTSSSSGGSTAIASGSTDTGTPATTSGSGGTTSTTAGPGGGSGDPGGVALGEALWVPVQGTPGTAKIDTVAGVELGRYPATGATVSVSPDGDAAIVTNDGDLSVIAGSLGRCVDANSDGTIQTSAGAGDLLPVGADECVIWSSNAGIRGPVVAYNPDATWLWTGGELNTTTDPGLVTRIDTLTGDLLDLGPLPCTYDIGLLVDQCVLEIPDWHGSVEGIVEPGGALWVFGTTQLTRIDPVVFAVGNWALPSPYPASMAMDASGFVWLSVDSGVVYRFDPTAEEFMYIGELGVPAEQIVHVRVTEHGIRAIASDCSVATIDQISGTLGPFVMPQFVPGAPECALAIGAALDSEGDIWLSYANDSGVVQLDADSLVETARVTGIFAPLLNGDPTGMALAQVLP